MKSSKQRRKEILQKRRTRPASALRDDTRAIDPTPHNLVSVNAELLAPNNSYGAPDFVQRGYYVDRPFRCVDCGKEEVWTGTQQKWWYEVAKGGVLTIATRCRACRKIHREQKELHRAKTLAGYERNKKRAEQSLQPTAPSGRG